MTIHWCGTGLSSIPGLRHLLAEGPDVTVWNRTEARARSVVGDLTQDIRTFDPDALGEAVKPGDIVISMLPGDWHPILARIALERQAHLVTSSYISPAMTALDQQARDAQVCLVNEVGLDPGIDHLMAHHLVADYRASDVFDLANEISFTSYCGGVPNEPNPFRYKFSWAPVGVLKALKSPSRSLADFEVVDAARPWDALSSYRAPLNPPEVFEVYPNRDSLPFMAQYGMGEDWRVRDFVRGTLRLNGWSEAWADTFKAVETATETELEAIAQRLLAENAYAAGEPDRVVLCVSLRAERDGQSVWHKSYVMDAWGDKRGSAMARLVSIPVALAVKAVQAGRIPNGVSAAPSDPALVRAWLDEVALLAQDLRVVDHLAP
jgi:saccharopine dehydrogenase (NADP+, L-glutamate forming)